MCLYISSIYFYYINCTYIHTYAHKYMIFSPSKKLWQLRKMSHGGKLLMKIIEAVKSTEQRKEKLPESRNGTVRNEQAGQAGQVDRTDKLQAW